MANFDERTFWNWQMFFFVLNEAVRMPSMSTVYELYHHGDANVKKYPSREGYCALKMSQELPELLSRVYADQAGKDTKDNARCTRSYKPISRCFE